MGAACCNQHEDDCRGTTAVLVQSTERPGGDEGAVSRGVRGRHLVLLLGTASWHAPEPATASGHLHEAHHLAFNAMDNAACYSVYPSALHDHYPGDKRVHVVRVPQTPTSKCTSESSGKGWNSMSNKEVEAYLRCLEDGVHETMRRAEEEQHCSFTLAMAYHAFLGPAALRRVIQRRMKAGRKPTPIAVVCAGEELDAHSGGRQGAVAVRSRLKVMLDLEAVYGDQKAGVQAAILPSEQAKARFFEHFPEFPADRTFISLLGYSPAIFYPREMALAEALSRCFDKAGPDTTSAAVQRVVVFVSDSHSLAHTGAAVRAARVYEREHPDVLTVILRGGEPCQDSAPDVAELERTCFGEVRSHADAASLYSVADVCVFLSDREPSCMLLVECMACGTPVIGVASGAARSFVTEEVGALVSRTPHMDAFSDELGARIGVALAQGWKTAKRAACVELCKGFSADQQCLEMVKNIADMIEQ